MQDVLEASRLKKLYEISSITFISIFMVKWPTIILDYKIKLCSNLTCQQENTDNPWLVEWFLYVKLLKNVWTQ
jgi:hypothetical protein